MISRGGMHVGAGRFSFDLVCHLSESTILVSLTNCPRLRLSRDGRSCHTMESRGGHSGRLSFETRQLQALAVDSVFCGLSFLPRLKQRDAS
jgi:hypothetical protein